MNSVAFCFLNHLSKNVLAGLLFPTQAVRDLDNDVADLLRPDVSQPLDWPLSHMFTDDYNDDDDGD